MQRSLLLATALALTAPLVGCTVYTRPAAVVETYDPVYYNGAVVYYDDVGVPYYYDGPTVVYVPRTYVHYGVLVDNYHRHGPSYRAWSRNHPPRAVYRHGPPRPRYRR